MTLRDLLDALGELDDDGTIYAEGGANARPDSAAVARREYDAVPEASGTLSYVLEVSEAKEVIDVWRDWRGGAEPSSDDRYAAVLHYAATDAYLPV